MSVTILQYSHYFINYLLCEKARMMIAPKEENLF